jgi:hypothetical protein
MCGLPNTADTVRQPAAASLRLAHFFRYEVRAFLVGHIVGNGDATDVHSTVAVPAGQRLVNTA